MRCFRSPALIRRMKLVPIFFVALMPTTVSGQRICCEGDRWLKWHSKLRENYVWGYLEGARAYRRGCHDALRALQPKEAVDVTAICSKHQPDFSKGSDWLSQQVTQFYKLYPRDKDIYIDEVLEQLGNGLTLKEIDKYPFWRHNRAADETTQ